MTKQYAMNPQSVVFRDGPNKRERERDRFREIAALRAQVAYRIPLARALRLAYRKQIINTK